MIESAARRVASHMGRRTVAYRATAGLVVQTAVAAALSWWIAHDVLGHTGSYFAPIASTIVLSVRPGPRSRRAVHMVVGIALGIGIGDVIVRVIGVGPLQIGLVVFLAVSAAILLGAGTTIINQAAGTAVLVAAIPAPSAAGTRFVDALVGGVVGLVVLATIARNPVVPLRRSVEPFLAETSEVLGAAASALEEADAAAAGEALSRAYAAGRLGETFEKLVEQSRETARIAPTRWILLSEVERYVQAAPHVDSLGRDARVLCRAIRSAIESGAEVPAELPGAVRDLAGAVGALPGLLAGGADEEDVVGRALGAAAAATASLVEGADLSVAIIVGQVRSSAVDLLRSLGVERRDASAHVRAARQVW